MSNSTESHFLRTILPALPSEFSQQLRTLCSSNASNEAFLENFVRFLAGADCTPDSSKGLRAQWLEKQVNAAALKRAREDSGSEGSKRQRMSPTDAPTISGTANTNAPEASSSAAAEDPIQFILHSISTTSPVRKKVDIEIRKDSITFTNPTSRKVEATVPIPCLRRAFILPTRGKTKAHWTVVMTSSDYTGTAKGAPLAKDNPQIIFGLDATTTADLSTTEYKGSPESKTTIPKGSPTIAAIRQLLSHLPNTVVYEPSVDEFKSSVNQFGSSTKSASEVGVPGLEAYRAAKQGSLWFMKEGLLWGESKPCEFWAIEDLLDPSEGVRLSPGSGRVFSVHLVRKSRKDDAGGDDKMQVENGEQEEEEDLGIETELGMVDSRERDGVFEWVRKHQNMFGRKPGNALSAEEEEEVAAAAKAAKIAAQQLAGPSTIRSLALDSDSEDEDFVGSESDDGSGSESGDDEESGSGGDDGDEEEAEGSDEEDAEGDEDEGEGGTLDPAHHPLMRPGAVPKMSKAAMNMVVGMVEDDLMGGPGDGEEEVDELED
ncbi:histone chaperone Rttp106-like-domain-containing protein [Ephemerocybe angulata]|uniref:Histone chaperone Rttp106-like-domain-containing protein n=1 Tax=Ephemerocybe angulata TaxID=980116 RepID=A0A8H6HNR2_9AGAR|nr:histone chaperone Rttp106-like-domain-containing protein [Tulosesus angulatus]